MKKGFTLIELLGVIIIISILVLITTFSVSSIINGTKESLNENQKHNIEVAAQTYYLKEGMNDNVTCVNIKTLIDKGYIEGKEVTDLETKDALNGSVKITYEANQYIYEYKENSCE